MAGIIISYKFYQDDYNPVTNDEKNRTEDSDSVPSDGREQWGMYSLDVSYITHKRSLTDSLTH